MSIYENQMDDMITGSLYHQEMYYEILDENRKLIIDKSNISVEQIDEWLKITDHPIHTEEFKNWFIKYLTDIRINKLNRIINR